MEIQEENSVLMMQSLGINNTEDQVSFSDEKSQLQNKREDETQLVKSFNELLLQLNLRLVEKEELLEKYRNENKLLKGRLKGYETLGMFNILFSFCCKQEILLNVSEESYFNLHLLALV